MKQVLVALAFLVSAVSAQALSILPITKMGVHQVITELRPNGQGGYFGPISIVRGELEAMVKVVVDHNICSPEGFCTEMAPFEFDAQLQLLEIRSSYEKFLVVLEKPFKGIVEAEYELTVFLDSSEALLESSKQSLKAKSYVWVLKQDGSVKCISGGATPQEMSLELIDQGIEVLNMRKATTGAISPTVCGIPSDKSNVFLIPHGDLDAAKALGFYHLDAYPYAQFLD